MVGVDWYDGLEGSQYTDAPSLAVAFSNGRAQITRRESDEAPVVVDTGMQLTHCRWNTNGSVLALTGKQRGKSSSGEVVRCPHPRACVGPSSPTLLARMPVRACVRRER